MKTTRTETISKKFFPILVLFTVAVLFSTSANAQNAVPLQSYPEIHDNDNSISSEQAQLTGLQALPNPSPLDLLRIQFLQGCVTLQQDAQSNYTTLNQTQRDALTLQVTSLKEQISIAESSPGVEDTVLDPDTTPSVATDADPQ